MPIIFETIDGPDSPNQGREKINRNFAKLTGATDGSSGGTISSGATLIQNGINTFTGGTYDFPTVNITALTIDSIIVTGTSTFYSLSATSISATTFYSGSTPLSSIFAPASIASGSGATFVQGGINTFTAGTSYFPSVNVTALTIDTLVVSGATSLGVVSATTFYSGSTPLSSIFAPASIASGSGATFVQGGINTFTAGTSYFPSVNVTALTIDTLVVSGATSLGVVSATTFYSGSTPLGSIFPTLSAVSNYFLPLSGGTMTGNINMSNNVTMNSNSLTGFSIDFGSSGGSERVRLRGDHNDNYVLITSAKTHVNHIDLVLFGIDKAESIRIQDNNTQNIIGGSSAGQAVIILSNSSIINSGVSNTVIIGGESLSAVNSNTVYMPSIAGSGSFSTGVVKVSGPIYSADSTNHCILVSGYTSATTIYLPYYAYPGTEIEIKDYAYTAATYNITMRVAGENSTIRKAGGLTNFDLIDTDGKYKKYKFYDGEWVLMFTALESV